MNAIAMRASINFFGVRLPARSFSVRLYPVITETFVSKYDQFKSLPTDQKISRLTHRTLDMLLKHEEKSISLQEKWKQLQLALAKQGTFLPNYNSPDTLSKSLSNLIRLLYHVPIPTVRSEDDPFSATTRQWEETNTISYPLEGEPTTEQKFIAQTLPKYVKDKTALIGAATWNSNETFYFLRSLVDHSEARKRVHYVANIEVNPLNSRLAHVVSHELGLNVALFKTIQGNALSALPYIPFALATQQTIIACRFIPTLTFEEISRLISQICETLAKTNGVAILTYSTITLSDWEHPQTDSMKILIEAYKAKLFYIEEIRGKTDELLGVSFIQKDNEVTFQTFLFNEKIEQFFSEQNVSILERKIIGFENNHQREIVVLTLRVDKV